MKKYTCETCKFFETCQSDTPEESCWEEKEAADGH